MMDWLDYWNEIPNTPNEYTQGNQDDWDYNWGSVFDQSGILHP